MFSNRIKGNCLNCSGVAAKSGQMTNVKKTFFGFKRLLGRKYDDPHVKAELGRLVLKHAYKIRIS